MTMGPYDIMSFKKNGTDPEFNRRPAIGLSFVGAMFMLLGIGQPGAYPENLPRYERGKRPQQKRAKRRNMLHVSKRVRRKHRRAA